MDDGEEEEEVADELSKIETTGFRGLAARANYLAQDRPDVQFSAKEICRRMSRPRQRDWESLKRLARYLVRYPELIISLASAAL